jgi:branched-chain amino acid transport system permease protein/urea transport system permease protein
VADLVVIALNALTLISILMLVGLGLAIIFGLMNIINLAHGEFVTLGAFAVAIVQLNGGSFWLGLLLAPMVGALTGLALELAVIRFLYTRPIGTILATWGISLAIQQSLEIAFGPGPKAAVAPVAGTLSIMGARYPSYRLIVIAMAAAIMAAVVIMFRVSAFGLNIRTTIQNRDMAAALGINVGRVYSAAFALGAAIAATAGALIAPLATVLPQMGVNYLARSFFVVIVGGTGGVGGVLAGSALVGGFESVFTFYMAPTLAQALVLILAIVLVRVRPQGLVQA